MLKRGKEKRGKWWGSNNRVDTASHRDTENVTTKVIQNTQSLSSFHKVLRPVCNSAVTCELYLQSNWQQYWMQSGGYHLLSVSKTPWRSPVSCAASKFYNGACFQSSTESSQVGMAEMQKVIKKRKEKKWRTSHYCTLLSSEFLKHWITKFKIMLRLRFVVLNQSPFGIWVISACKLL